MRRLTGTTWLVIRWARCECYPLESDQSPMAKPPEVPEEGPRWVRTRCAPYVSPMEGGMRVILLLAAFLAVGAVVPVDATAQATKPNIVIIWGDDIGQSNVSAYSHGVMGYQTPNIDRVAREGMMFTDAYAEQSCTAGRASFITGQSGLRTGMTKVG